MWYKYRTCSAQPRVKWFHRFEAPSLIFLSLHSCSLKPWIKLMSRWFYHHTFLVIPCAEWFPQCFSDAFDLLFGVVILRLQDGLDISHIQGQGISVSPFTFRHASAILYRPKCCLFPQTICFRPMRSPQVATRRWWFQSVYKRTQTPVRQKQPAVRAAQSSSEVNE